MILKLQFALSQGKFEVLNDLRKDKSKFDFIFLDGPKGQYFKYLPILKDLLNKNGCLLADDILFHGYKSLSVG